MKKGKMNFGIEGGYNVPFMVWENQRRVLMQRAFNFAAKERELKGEE